MQGINQEYVAIARVAGFLTPAKVSGQEMFFGDNPLTIEREKAEKFAEIFAKNANIPLENITIDLKEFVFTILELECNVWYPAKLNSEDIYPITELDGRKIGRNQDQANALANLMAKKESKLYLSFIGERVKKAINTALPTD
jgi:hypothetical protein